MANNQLLEAFYSLGKRINKRFGNENTPETEEGIVSEKFPELKLTMPNEDLLKLSDKWERNWTTSEVYSLWMQQADDNENYWMGKQFQEAKVNKHRPLVDNVLFEALETYLPQVTQHNPEPLVVLGAGVPQDEQSQAHATQLKLKLGELADTQKLRLKLKKSSRHWAIYLLGAAKVGWDMDRDCPTVKIIRPKRLILDPESTVDEDGYTGEFIGEHRKLQAGVMIDMLDGIGGEGDYTKIITDLVENNLGTEIGFIEWWTDSYMFWTLKGKHVLMKKKNPHWNYEENQEQAAPEPAEPGTEPMVEAGETGTMPQSPMDGNMEQPTDQMSEEQTPEPTGTNHLPKPSKPYILLSVFNLGNQPIDNTSLMGQNLASQDLINKRVKQIDKNADSMNGGMVVSLERSGLTLAQASGVTKALAKGGTIAIPAGAVNEAIARMSAPPLPNDVYLQLQDTRTRVQYIFGTKGFQPSQGGSQSVVRSQILNKNLDEARISGGFAEYLEQFADAIYNWWVQLLYVYDDQYAGKQFVPVNISIKEGSLLPKDSASISAQAIQLAESNRMSLLDLYKRLEYENPEELAANVWLEANAPEILFANDPRVQQAIQAKQQAAQGAEKKPVSESINFKDLPPEGRAQMAAQAGIQLHPEAIAAHDHVVSERGRPIPAVNQVKQQPQ